MGSSIGHKATDAFTQAFTHESWNWKTNPVDNAPLEDKKKAEDLEEEAGDMVEEDYRYVIDSNEECSDAEAKDDEEFGREDEEEPWEMDNVQAEGFDDL